MSKRIAELTCPECDKPIKVPFEIKEPPTLDEITNSLKEAIKGHATADQLQKVIEEQLKPAKEYHQHKTFDELYECPGCKPFVETAQRYQVTKKEPEKEPEPKEQPVGSIFGTKTGD